MKKWVEKICYALCNQTTKNTTRAYIEYAREYQGKEVSASCALGELLLQKPIRGKMQSNSHKIKESLIKKYKVPKDMVEEIFDYINSLNVTYCYTKKQISKKVKEKYE